MTYSYPMETEFLKPPAIPGAEGLLHGKFDRTFRNICEAGWANESDGDVESPYGHFSLVEIPEPGGELDELIAACEVGREYDDGVHQYPLPAPGWYVAVVDSNGFWWVYATATQSESGARWIFSVMRDQYSQWDKE